MVFLIEDYNQAIYFPNVFILVEFVRVEHFLQLPDLSRMVEFALGTF
jgi:hypothetical protein